MTRSEEDLIILREYIDNNPAIWLLGENYLDSGIAKGQV
jgi:hypothetical protein